jgi:hypothetical protein
MRARPRVIGLTGALAATLLLVGCAATPYEPKGDSRFGYSETWLSPDEIEVFFDGNSQTATERAFDFVLLRGADLALASGYSHFVPLERTFEIDQVYSSSPATYTTIGTASGGTFTSQTTAFGGDTYAYASPRARVRVRLTREAGDGAFDAAFVSQSIRSKYALP